MRKYKIYCLKHPSTLEIKYIGVTISSLSTRLCQHKHDAVKKNSDKYVSRWIRKVVSEGLFPIIELVEEVTKDTWEEREKYWIAFYDNLTNTREGGKGLVINRDVSGIQRSAEAHKKPVCLLTKNFDFVGKFSSLKECAEFLVVCETAVGQVLSGRNTHVKGYVVVSQADYSSGNYEKVFKGRSKDVYQYNLDGELIKIYNRLSDVYHSNNELKTNHIDTACKNLWVHKGFIWSYTKLDNIKEIAENKRKRKNNGTKP